MSTAPSTGSKLSEQEFLRLEAELARRAAAEALLNAKVALGATMDPRKLARKHPIVSLIGAIVGGFVAAAVTVPSKEEQELRRLRRLHEAMHPPAPPVAPHVNGNGAETKPAEKPTLWATILHEVIALIKPILLATITAGIKSASAPQAPADRGVQ
jgi:hypothetical protein